MNLNKDMVFKWTYHKGRALHGGKGRWPIPRRGKPGAWRAELPEPLVACLHGYHLMTWVHLPVWVGPHLWVADYRGSAKVANNKFVVHQARLVAPVETWTPRVAMQFAVSALILRLEPYCSHTQVQYHVFYLKQMRKHLMVSHVKSRLAEGGSVSPVPDVVVRWWMDMMRLYHYAKANGLQGLAYVAAGARSLFCDTQPWWVNCHEVAAGCRSAVFAEAGGSAYFAGYQDPVATEAWEEERDVQARILWHYLTQEEI